MDGVANSGDRVAQTLDRCGRSVARLVDRTGDQAEIDTAIADLLSLPDDVPQRGVLAGALLAVLVRPKQVAEPHLPHLGTLLEIADRDPPPWPQWPVVRSMVRLRLAVKSDGVGGTPDFKASLAALDDLVMPADAAREFEPILEFARTVLTSFQDFRNDDEGALRRMPAAIEQFRRTLDDRRSALPPELVSGLSSMLDLLDSATGFMVTGPRAGDSGAALLAVRRFLDEVPPDRVPPDVMIRAASLFSYPAALDGPAAASVDGQMAVLRAAVERPDASGAERAYLHRALGRAALGRPAEADVPRIDQAIGHFRQALAVPASEDSGRVFGLLLLAMVLATRFRATGRLDDLTEAERALLEARELAGGPGNRYWLPINKHLFLVQRVLGDHPGARKVALDGLRRHAWKVLLQTDAAAAMAAAAQAAADAVEIARRCVTDGEPADAIQALDAGRGLMLFAATAYRDVAARLDAVGRPDLSEQWRVAAEAGGLDTVPVELRREVLASLARPTEVGVAGTAALLESPSLSDIRSALAALDVDALVYLVPGKQPTPGFAVIASAHGPPSGIRLPHLSVEGEVEVERYLSRLSRRDLALARRGTTGPGTGSPDATGATDEVRELAVETANSRFVGSLDALCDWAWRAAIGPLLEMYLPTLRAPTSGRPPRLVLVPMGSLARIPWQAARRPDGTYAVQLAAFSQAASARMFCESAGRPAVPLTPVGLVVGDPDTGRRGEALLDARVEAYAIHQSFYRGARYVGRRPDGEPSRSGAGTAGQVRAWLTSDHPGAGGMLHLACHGVIEVGSKDATSYLMLAGGERLAAEELVGLLAETPERAIGLVVLAACRTGVSSRGYDEAYSLGTAFLAAGARSVLSTQWRIPDRITSVLMFMFHHFLMAERRPAWDALRRAQLWMLDPDRRLPETMPPRLRRQVHRSDPAEVVGWAGFVHGGQ